MKIAIYSPYLDTFGGGEKYMMSIAEILSIKGTVDVLLDRHLANLGKNYLIDKLSERFNLNLKNVNFKEAPIGKESSHVNRLFFIKKYDILFYLTDGSIFFPTAKKNILHIQSPLVGEKNSSWKKIKLNQWDLIIYNSKFTQTNSQKYWPIRSEIIYPPVDVDKIKALKKKNYILSVGRFFGYLKDKKHAVLIKTFKDLLEDKNAKNWSLHLVGSAGEGDEEYLAELKQQAEGFPINFYPNLGYDKLVNLYGESSIYWHASGFKEVDPTKMEHFGISTVEAMAGGCVPVVINKGGQTEIVEPSKSGYLWDTPEDLKEFSLKLIENPQIRQKMANQAIERAGDFSKQKFESRIIEIAKI